MQSRQGFFLQANEALFMYHPLMLFSSLCSLAVNKEVLRMQKEFSFTQPSYITLDLGEKYLPIHEDQACIVTNNPLTKAEVYAPEINFYLRHSTADKKHKSEAVKTLYEIRMTAFDLAQQTEMSITAGHRILIVSGLEQSLLGNKLDELGFEVLQVQASSIVTLDKQQNGLQVSVLEGETTFILEADQILWGNCPKEYTALPAVHDHEILGQQKTIERVLAGCRTISYNIQVKYNSSLCLYHDKRQEICGQCANVCPTQAIVKRQQPLRLEIMHARCSGCGACVAACPTGAMDSSRIPRNAFRQIARLFTGYTAMIIPSSLDLEKLDCELDTGILPLVIDDSLLDEWHLLSLVQTSGMPAIYCPDERTDLTENIVRVVNEIFLKRFQQKAVILCETPEDLKRETAQIKPLDAARFELDERSLTKRQAIAKRLQHLIEAEDLGAVDTAPYLHYGMLRLNQDACTLCLSCVDGCTPGALQIDKEQNTLDFIPALCTCCGYCLQTCPENDCLKIYRDQLVLHPEFFRRRVMARDEIFKCVECGRGFAPAKSVSRIAAIMAPKFADDSLRSKTLYCCPECKARVMLEGLKEIESF
ncbi:MAG: hypothetical protein CSB23_02995 [Deltaproteobacteria bacterium]|nr:MAG: hypothetical protein CSB23_02995 [Deltaproteobacteria bacterium]